MARIAALAVAAAIGLAALPAAALQPDDFNLRTTRDLLTLCEAPRTDRDHDAALGTCYGYLIGAFHYHRASTGPSRRPVVCPPAETPNFQDTIRGFVGWARANPQFNNELPVDTLFRYLVQTWPCARRTPAARRG